MGAAPPKAATDYDVVVIGSGVGGYTAANRAGQLGLKTACVEGAAVLGGTRLNVGCIPSKALLHASKLFDLARTKFAGFGIKVSPELDLPTMMVQKQASVDALRHGIEFLFRKNKVDRIDGWARLAGPGNVQVRKPDGSEIQPTTRHVIIATGSIPTPPDGCDRRPSADCRFDRCAHVARGTREAAGDRRGQHWSRAWFRLAPPGR